MIYHFNKYLKKRVLGYLIRIATYLILMFIILYIDFPYIWMIKSSFTIERDILTSTPKLLTATYTLDNWFRAFRSIIPSLINSIIISGVSLILSVLIGSLAGFALSRFELKGKLGVITLVTFVQIIPRMTLLVPLYSIFSSLGLLDSYLGMILVYTTIQLPFATLIMKSFFDELPKELDEAALVDGASRIRTFFSITLPISTPGIIATSILLLMYAWNEFALPVVLSGPKTKTITVAVAENIGQRYVDLGPLFASGCIAILPLLIFSFVIQKYLVRGILAGAVKI